MRRYPDDYENFLLTDDEYIARISRQLGYEAASPSWYEYDGPGDDDDFDEDDDDHYDDDEDDYDYYEDSYN